MQNNRFNYLFEQYFKGVATLEESNEFLNIVEDDLNRDRVQVLMEEYWKKVASDEVVFFSEDQRDRMFTAVFKANQHVEVKNTYKLWLRFTGIAAAVALIVMGIYFFNYNNKTKESQSTAYANDIDPGKVGATLTLANGKKISLKDASSGELANEEGISIRKTANGQVVYEIKKKSGTSDKVNTLTTDKGETYTLILPDKSKVWLNAASSLTYSASLNEHGLRKVKLQGEAYFEIFKDKAHPFIVETDEQEIEVLGTHFNVNSYKDEGEVKTTLLEGSVKVAPLPAKRRGLSKTIERPGSQRGVRVLKPNQQSVFKNNEITIEAADPGVTDWKNGDFYLDRIDFRVAMRKIARWYNVEMIYAQDVPDTLEVGGWISRNNKLSEVLKSIEKSGIARFKIEGHKVYVYR